MSGMVMEPQKAQTDLEQAIVALAHDLPKMAIKEVCTRLDWLRRQAMLEGIVPAAMLADGFAHAITRQGTTRPSAPGSTPCRSRRPAAATMATSGRSCLLPSAFASRSDRALNGAADHSDQDYWEAESIFGG